MPKYTWHTTMEGTRFYRVKVYSAERMKKVLCCPVCLADLAGAETLCGSCDVYVHFFCVRRGWYPWESGLDDSRPRCLDCFIGSEL